MARNETVEQDSDEEELLELPDSWTEKDEEPEEYW